MTDEERRLEPPDGPTYAEIIEAATTPQDRNAYRAALEVIRSLTKDILWDDRLSQDDIDNYFGRLP